MNRDAPPREPHGPLTNIQLMHMTKLTREHVNGLPSPTNVTSDGRFHSVYRGTSGRQK